jgi:hypothetical protein
MSKVYIDKKDRDFQESKAPIINLINSILKTMEQIQWHMSTPRNEGGSIMKAINLLTSAENRVKIPETEEQLLADRNNLNASAIACRIKTAEVYPMINRFNQYLLSDLFAEQHGITFQNKSPKHIGSDEE